MIGHLPRNRKRYQDDPDRVTNRCLVTRRSLTTYLRKWETKRGIARREGAYPVRYNGSPLFLVSDGSLVQPRVRSPVAYLFLIRTVLSVSHLRRVCRWSPTYLFVLHPICMLLYAKTEFLLPVRLFLYLPRTSIIHFVRSMFTCSILT